MTSVAELCVETMQAGRDRAQMKQVGCELTVLRPSDGIEVFTLLVSCCIRLMFSKNGGWGQGPSACGNARYRGCSPDRRLGGGGCTMVNLGHSSPLQVGPSQPLHGGGILTTEALQEYLKVVLALKYEEKPPYASLRSGMHALLQDLQVSAYDPIDLWVAP